MQLTLPPTNYANNQRSIMASVAISEYVDDNNEQYQTPNATLNRDEEFRTPLTEIPPSNVGGLSAQALYGAAQSLSPTYYSLASSENSHSDSQLNENDTGSEGTAEDSGLDENYHTPRVTKIKSMENLSLLEMEFHKASQELDRNSPRRLKMLADEEHLPKMKSMNNLCADQYTQEQLLQEFEAIREHSLEETTKLSNNTQRKQSSGSGKVFAKHKVGNAKFIGGDDTPGMDIQREIQPFAALRHLKGAPAHPIQKIRSMGTIPDVVGEERILTDPFLTPTSGRKPQFPLVTQSAEKATPSSYMKRLLSQDMVDGRSLQEFYTDRRSRLITEPALSHMSRSPFERAYKRSFVKSSTPLRQSVSVMQQQHQVLSEVESRPHSTNAAYDLMSRSYSGVPRRLLDGSNRQISYIALSSTTSPNASASPYGTMGSLNSTHSASSSSGSSSSGAVITFQCTGVSGSQVSSDVVDGVVPTVHTPASGANSPRRAHLSSAELSSLAASPTDACSIRSNPSAVSLLAAAAAAEASLPPTTSMSGCNLSPLATTQIIRRPSITMCVQAT